MAPNPSVVYLLDTSVVLAVVRGKGLGKYLTDTFGLMDLVYRPMISIVSHGELWVMADRNGWGDSKRDALVKTLSSLVAIDLNDQSIIDAYVEVSRASQEHPQGSRVLSDNDKWIAATARAVQAALLTTDRDFVHLNPDCCSVHYVDPIHGVQPES